MYQNAFDKIHKKIAKALDWKSFMSELNKLQIIKTPWCKNNECEEQVKLKSKNESMDI